MYMKIFCLRNLSIIFISKETNLPAYNVITIMPKLSMLELMLLTT